MDFLLPEQPLIALLLIPSIEFTVLLILAIGVEMLRLSTDPFFAMLKYLFEKESLLLKNVTLTFLDYRSVTMSFSGLLLAGITLKVIILRRLG